MSAGQGEHKRRTDHAEAGDSLLRIKIQIQVQIMNASITCIVHACDAYAHLYMHSSTTALIQFSLNTVTALIPNYFLFIAAVPAVPVDLASNHSSSK